MKIVKDKIFVRKYFSHRNIIKYINCSFHECSFYNIEKCQYKNCEFFDVRNENQVIKKLLNPFKKEDCFGYKIGKSKSYDNCLVKLLIPKDAEKIYFCSTNKCRASEAKVISITNIVSGKELKECHSCYRRSFKYRVDSVVKPHFFDKCDGNVCTGGIHFFMTIKEALAYME